MAAGQQLTCRHTPPGQTSTCAPSMPFPAKLPSSHTSGTVASCAVSKALTGSLRERKDGQSTAAATQLPATLSINSAMTREREFDRTVRPPAKTRKHDELKKDCH